MSNFKGKNTCEITDISNYFIELSLSKEIDNGVSEGITNLKLQKILYFAQCAYLSMEGEELFSDEIAAWKYGPVVESVYHTYKSYVNAPLELPTSYSSNLPNETKLFLDGIWELFSKYSAMELVNITHSHKPWIEAFEKGSGTVIEKDILADYYKGIFEFQEDEEAVS